MGKCCFITLLFVGIAFISQNVSAQDPIPGAPPKPYTYLDEANWGNLDPSYKLCSTGTQQSPISIMTKQATVNKTLPRLLIDYTIPTATLESDGLAGNLVVTGKSEFTLDGKVYSLRNMRWHVPSEHIIDNVTGVAEMHRIFVSNDESKSTMIIATLYRLAGPDPIVASLEEDIRKLSRLMATGKGRSIDVSMTTFRPDYLKLIANDKYVKYMGSLTYPPCTENVVWIVITDVQVITAKQVKEITLLQTKENLNNARPVKPLNGRVVEIALIKG